MAQHLSWRVPNDGGRGVPPRVALHGPDEPEKVLGVADEWILQPEDPWEVTGYVPNVVFCCGAVPEAGGTVKLHWGGADTVMCAGEVRVEDLTSLCLEKPRPAL